MIKVVNIVMGFIGGVYVGQKYKIPCIETEFYKIVKEIEDRKKK